MTPSKRQKDVNLGNPHPGGEGSSVCEAGVLLLWGMFLSPISWDPSPEVSCYLWNRLCRGKAGPLVPFSPQL